MDAARTFVHRNDDLLNAGDVEQIGSLYADDAEIVHDVGVAATPTTSS
jgi:hypothetical protein